MIAGLGGLVAAFALYRAIRRRPAGSAAMQAIAALIRTAALAFLKREYTVLLPFIAVVAGRLAWAIGWRTGVAYVAGGVCSILAGLFGMRAATHANVRTAEAARAHGQGPALRTAFQGGAVMGLAVASLGLLGIGVVTRPSLADAFSADGWRASGQVITGFAMGASPIALFA